MSQPELRLTLPVIELEHIRLRPWRVTDTAALAAAWVDPEVVARSSVPVDSSRTAAERWIDGAEQRCRRGLSVDLAIVGSADDEVIGEVGLSSIDQRRRAALIGWWVAAAARGQGAASAAVAGFTGWALADAGFAAVVAEITDDNGASLQVAKNCGFIPLGPGSWVRTA